MRRFVLALVLAVLAVLAVPAPAQAAGVSTTVPVSAFPAIDDGHGYALTSIGGHLFVGGRLPGGNLWRIDAPTWRITHYTSPVVRAMAATGQRFLAGGAGYLTSRDLAGGATRTLTLASGEVVNGMAGSGGKVLVATTKRAMLVSADLRRVYWSRATSGWATTALWQDSRHAYIGGNFTAYGGLARQSVVRIYVPSGNPFTSFNAHLQGNDVVANREAVGAMVFGHDPDRLILGIGGHLTNGVRWVSKASGAHYHYRESVGDVQALATWKARIISGCHSNSRFDNSYGGYRMATSWAMDIGSLPHYRDWDLGLSQHYVGNPDGQNGGVQSFRIWAGMLVVAGEFTGWGDYTATKYGTFVAGVDLHPRQALLAYVLAA